MPLPSPYRNPGRWRAVVFRQEVRHGTAGCLLSLVLLAPLLVREWGLAWVVTAIAFYSGILVPAITGYFSLPKLLLRMSRPVAACLTFRASSNGFSRLSAWAAASIGWWAAVAGQWTVWLVVGIMKGLLRACVVPVMVVASLVGVLHGTYFSLHGVRTTTNQVVFFLMVQELVTPRAHLTALYFLLFYTVLLYIYRALFTRQWARAVQMGHPRDLARLAVWYMAARLGKGVAMSFVLVMFTLQFSHVEPDLTFIVVTFAYFLITQHKWTGEERVVEWVRMFHLAVFEEAEHFWVPAVAIVLPVAASVGIFAALVPARPWLLAAAAYANLLVPGMVVARWVQGQGSPHAAVLSTCRRATTQELAEHPSCPVCLEELHQARVTPCLHLYHASCLAACLTHSSLCPLCKQPI